jgi:arylsulfatase A
MCISRLLLIVSSCFCSFVSAVELPNILIIYTDDQGYGDASCLNPKSKIPTPHLDRLASEGISFTNGHSSDTVCTPSRYGLLTGRYSWRTTLKRGVYHAERACLIANGRMTIASMLKTQGYTTAMIGKWHLGMDFPGESHRNRDWTKPVRDMPLDKGFDYFFGIPASMNYGVLSWFRGRLAEVPPTLFTAKKPNKRHMDYRIMPPYQQTPAETKKVVGVTGMEVAPDFIDNQCLTRFTDESIAWMDQHTKQDGYKPFFLYLPYTSPHYPVCPLPEFWGKGGAGGYGEFMIETDHHVGRILAFLDKSGLADNTLIIYTSDNGPEDSWRERIEEFGHASNGIYRGGKRDIYEGGHRVPFFVRWPVGIKNPGRSFNGPIGQIDILSTLAEITGAEVPVSAAEDSQSFAKVLTDPNAKHERQPLINHSSSGRFAVTSGNWKLILPSNARKRAPASAAELYDLAKDPGEKNNVIANHPKIASSLERQITGIIVNGRTTPGTKQQNDTDHWTNLNWITPEEYSKQAPSSK